MKIRFCPVIAVVLWLACDLACAQPSTRPAGGVAVQQEGNAFVAVVGLDHLGDSPAKPLNLQGHTLRFTPAASGGYDVANERQAKLLPTQRHLDDADATGPRQAQSWTVPLPFAFPFAGKTWRSAFVSRNGCVSLSKPEGDSWQQRDPWPDGGMRSIAAAIDSRAAAGLEEMIAVCWGPNDPDGGRCKVGINATPDGIAITWTSTRIPWGQAPAGPSTFQLRLHRNGEIEMAYAKLAESDGIVGLFTGELVAGTRLAHWQHDGKADASVDVESADLFDAGSVLRCVMTMRSPARDRLDKGSLDYRCLFGPRDFDGVGLHVGDQPPNATTSFLASSNHLGFRVQDKVVELDLPKLALAGMTTIAPTWNVIEWDKPGRNVTSPKTVPPIDVAALGTGEADFNAPIAARHGNVYEVFHYAAVTKESQQLLKRIYRTAPPDDDVALVFTDQRIDDLYGQGGGANPTNVKLEGVGDGNAHPASTVDLGTKQLQIAIATVWIGAAKFDESGTDDPTRRWNHFAHGVAWVAHECTHRWGMHMSFRDPTTNAIVPLCSAVGHWLEGLNTAAAFPVFGHYAEHPVAGYSIMGGSAWRENGDGTFTRNDWYGMPGGFSPLDLYVMGLLPPDKVPPTFLIDDPKDLGDNRFSGKKRVVRIEDIVAAMGPRVPAAIDAQKTFKMTLYLVHDSVTPVNPAALARAKKFSLAVADFFHQASGGAMTVVPAH